jgi:hypothetical protein
MDFSTISAAASSISIAKDLLRAVVGIRDFNEIALAVSKLNDQLLNAQDSLFKHQTQLLALQEQHFETTQKLRKAEEALAERGRYSLFALSEGVMVYRVNLTPMDGQVGDPVTTEPLHYVCQPCFDKGIKVVLQRIDHSLSTTHFCSNCRQNYLETTKPYTPPHRPPPSTRW